MNPHYQYFLAANGDAVSIKDDGRLKPTKPMVSPIVEYSKPLKEKPSYIGQEKPLPPPPTGTATRYKTCYAGCPDTEAVSVAMSDEQKNVKCPSSHPFSFKPSCNGVNYPIIKFSTKSLLIFTISIRKRFFTQLKCLVHRYFISINFIT